MIEKMVTLADEECVQMVSFYDNGFAPKVEVHKLELILTLLVEIIYFLIICVFLATMKSTPNGVKKQIIRFEEVCSDCGKSFPDERTLQVRDFFLRQCA